VLVAIPSPPRHRPDLGLILTSEVLLVKPDATARVVVNERTGTIVMVATYVPRRGRHGRLDLERQ
jgi:flagellar basal body P-ring protein FlgI